jgi:hypothetical protein
MMNLDMIIIEKLCGLTVSPLDLGFFNKLINLLLYFGINGTMYCEQIDWHAYAYGYSITCVVCFDMLFIIASRKTATLALFIILLGCCLFIRKLNIMLLYPKRAVDHLSFSGFVVND